ncbi:MAG: APC family permease [Chlamydiota bacterium]
MKSDHGKLKKAIGLPMLIAIGLSGVIGSGIFILPASLAATAGPGMLIAILFAGLIAAVLALAYAELGAAFPVTGGPFSFPRLALGDLGGFLMGWGYFLYLFIGTAAIANIFVVYLGFYLPGLTASGALTPLGIIFALLFVWLLTVVNILGVRWGGLYAVVMTVGRLIPLLFFCIVGLMALKKGVLHPFLPFGWEGVTLAVALFFWSYTGFEAVVVPIEEVKNPGKTIPWAMMMTVLLTIVIYVLIGIAFLGMVDWAALGLHQGEWGKLIALDAPLAEVVRSSSAWLAAFIAVGALLATGGAIGSWILVQGRLPFAMARNELFWSKMGKIGRLGTPVFSLIFSSALTSIVIIFIPHFVSLSLIASITAIVPYAAAALAVPILRQTRSEVVRPFALPLPHVVAIAAFIFATWLIYWAAWPWTCIGIILFLIGLFAFLFVPNKAFEWKRNVWLFAYLVGIAACSFLGGSEDTLIEDVAFPRPLGWLTLPYDLVALSLFAIAIYIWAYLANVRVKLKRESSQI